MLLLYKRYGGNFLVNLLGKWKESEYAEGQFIPIGGIAYYITAPSRWLNHFVHLFIFGSTFSYQHRSYILKQEYQLANICETTNPIGRYILCWDNYTKWNNQLELLHWSLSTIFNFICSFVTCTLVADLHVLLLFNCAAWEIWLLIHSMRFSTSSLCFQLVLSSQ